MPRQPTEGGAGGTDDGDLDLQLGLGELDITGMEHSFEDVDGHIQANLEDEIVKEALDKGLDLRVYSRQIESQLHEIERASVHDYVKESPNMAGLHGKIRSCDGVLERMEQMLGQFQNDLGNISGEIQSLQDQSLSMNVKLKNRKKVQASLSEYVGGMSISESLADTIHNGVVDEFYAEALEQLDRKLAYVAGKEQSASTDEVSQQLEVLTSTASARVREFVLSKIYGVRKPMSNLHLQQNTLLKLSEAFRFLAKHSKQTAIELRNEYVDTFSKVHATYFKAYLARLMKLQHEEIADKDDMMGADDGANRKASSWGFSSKPTLKSRTSVFTIGNRSSVIKELEEPILVPHAAKDAGKEARYPYEKLFRSLMFALMDTSSREFLFSVDFFKIKEEAALKFFHEVMGRSLSLVLKHEEARVATTFDSIGLVLCCRILSEYQQSLAEKNIPCLNDFIEKLLGLFWPRFDVIIEMNRASIDAINPSALATVDTRPHYIVRRYAEFSGSLLLLNEGGRFEHVTAGLRALRDEVGNFIMRVAAEFPNRREQLIFLINNYDMLLSVVNASTSTKSEEVSDFQKQLRKAIEEFAEECLSAPFGGLLAFVRSTEQKLERAKNPKEVPVDERHIESLTHAFAKEWKGAISTMQGDIMKSFTNFMNGTEILQNALSLMVGYYSRFLAILKAPPFKRSSGWPDLIDLHQLRVEVKKYKSMLG
eukprot:m.32256 g.32256  ORF g.32256 m.32256 type:complete len:710 (+) comp4878_c0_seq1:290-2419(+)